MDNKALADFVRVELSKVVSAINKLSLKISDQRQQRHTGIEPQHTTSDEHAGGPPESVITPPPADTTKTKKPDDYRYPRRSRRTKVWRQFKRVFLKKDRLERVGILFGIAYASATIWQWQDLRHNFMVEQRAWIRVKHAQFGKINEDTVIDGWPLTVSNVGKSPALRIYVHAVFEVLSSSKPPSFDLSIPHNGVDISTLFPADEDPFTAVMGPDIYNSRPVSRDDIRELMLGHKYICVWGQALYIDNFGKHWTRYCAWQDFSLNHSGNFSARPCIAWNTVGDGNPPK